jgi:DNA repair protein RAD5
VQLATHAMSDQHAFVRAVVGFEASDDLIASALRRAGGDLAAAVNIVLDAPKHQQPPKALPVPSLPQHDKTSSAEVASLATSSRQSAISELGGHDGPYVEAKPANLSEQPRTSTPSQVSKKRTGKQDRECCPDPPRPLKSQRLSESLQGMIPELRAIVGEHRSDECLAMALRRSGGDLAAAVNMVLDGTVSASPAAALQTEAANASQPPLLRVKKELVCEQRMATSAKKIPQCEVIDIDVEGPDEDTMRKPPDVAGATPTKPTRNASAAKVFEKFSTSLPEVLAEVHRMQKPPSSQFKWTPPSPDWSFVLGTMDVNAYSTRQVRPNETFTAEDGTTGPLLRSGACMELRMVEAFKRKARGFQSRQANSREGGSLKLYTCGLEVGRLPADIGKALVSLLKRDVIKVEARMGYPVPYELTLGTTVPVVLQIYLCGKALCSPDEVAGATRQKLAAGASASKKSKQMEEDTTNQANAKKPAKPTKPGFEEEEADHELQCTAISQLLRYLRLACNSYTAPAEPDGGASVDVAVCSEGGHEALFSASGIAEENGDEAAEEGEAQEDMTAAAGAQLGGRHALERADSPAVVLPEGLFNAKLRHYQAQAVFWMWQTENPVSKLPPSWIQGVSASHSEVSRDDSDEKKQTLHPMWDEYVLQMPIGPLQGFSQEPRHIYHHRTSGALSLIFPDASLAHCRGAVLADDMGLGKTVMCLGLLSIDRANDVSSAREAAPQLRALEASTPSVPQESRELSGFFRSSSRTAGTDDVGGTVVVMPLSLVSQWSAEALRHFPTARPLRVHEYHGAGRHYTAQQLRACDLVLTTYGTLAAEPEDGALFQVYWRRAILDEAHCIKNRSSRMAQAAFRLRALCRWCVTGTPLQNSVDELYSLIRFLRVDPWSSWSAWKKAVTLPLESARRGNPAAMAEALGAARRIIQPLLMRRTKLTKDPVTGEFLLQLPAKHVHTIELELSPAEREFYDAVYTQAKTQFDTFVAHGQAGSKYTQIFQLILKLRQALCHPFLVFTRDRSSDTDFASLERRCLTEMTKEAGASKAFVENLLTEVRSGTLADCPICLETPSDPAMTPCGHILCRDCALKATKTMKGECPVCRKPGALERGALKVLPGASRFPARLIAGASGSTGEGKESGVHAHSTKMKMLLDLLQEDIDSGRRAVVFSQWTSFLDLIGAALDTVGVPHQRFDGSLSREARHKCVQWLGEDSNDTKGRALLVSLKAGGVGLNLVAANRLYMLDLWWNPAVEEQAIQRVHRIGQKSEVHIFKFIVVDSIDVEMLQLQKAKSRLLEDAVEGGGQGPAVSKLTLDDLKRLFSPCKKSLKKLHGEADDDDIASDVDTSTIPPPVPPQPLHPPAASISRCPTLDHQRDQVMLLPKTSESAGGLRTHVHATATDAVEANAQESRIGGLNWGALSRCSPSREAGDAEIEESDSEVSDSDLLAACQADEQLAAQSLNSQALAPNFQHSAPALPARALVPPVASLFPPMFSTQAASAAMGSSHSIHDIGIPGEKADDTSSGILNMEDSDAVMCKCTPPMPATLLTVRKEGPNTGRQFYKCDGCNFFQWANAAGSSSTAGVAGGVQSPAAPRSNSSTNGACFKCGQSGHWARDCPTAGTGMRGKGGGKAGATCYKCGQLGHYASSCTQR